MRRRQALALGAGLGAGLAAPLALPGAARAAAGGQGVVRYAFPVAESGFDPAQISDTYSRTVTAHIFEALYGYDHLARPPKVVPLTADGLPEVNDDFRRWTFKVRPGIFFADDPAFKGQPRELTAADFVFAIKRYADPAVKSPLWASVEDWRMPGLAALRRHSLDRKTPFDYDAPVEGLRVLDRYRFELRFELPRPRFIDSMAVSDLFGGVAREVVLAYGDKIAEHPVGSGPFRLAQWRRSSLIVLERNPAYRERLWDCSPAADDKFEDLKRLPVLIPPLDEQQSIASFLDQKTKQLDKLIVNKKKLIGLLKEERTAIVNQAVTKGIDPNAKLKPSGIEWLGDIPEHWETKKMRYLVSKVGSGITPNGGANVYQETGIPLLPSQNIYSDGLILDDVAYISETIDEEMRNSHIEEGDVLLNITGGSIGRCFYVPRGFGRGNVNQHVCIIRPIKSLVATEYLHAVLVSGYGQNLIDMSQVGANREGLNFPQIKVFQIPYCDLSEQKLIVEFIAKKSSAFGATISKSEKEIEFLDSLLRSLS